MPTYDHIRRSDNILFEPNTNAQYWVVFPEGYKENYTKNSGNTSKFVYSVAWEDVADWKAGMMGYTEGSVGATTYRRTIPHRNPYATKQFLVDLELVSQTMTDAQNSARNPWGIDFGFENYPYGGWCQYAATYANYPYPIKRDSEVSSELDRYVRKVYRSIPRERRMPTGGFETCEDPSTRTQEVGFIPYVETEMIFTQFEVPLDLVPLDAIAKASGHVNLSEFDGKATETVLFRGLAQPIDPYPGPSGELYTNLVYNFCYKPPFGWNYIPKSVDQTTLEINWVRLRRRTSPPATGTANGEPLYPSAEFLPLFQPRAS